MSILFALPDDVCRYILNDWNEIIELGISMISLQSAENRSIYEWIHAKKIKLVGLKFSEALCDEKGSPTIPLDRFAIERVSVRFRNTSGYGSGLDEFLVSCENIRILRLTGITEMHKLHPLLLARLSQLSVESYKEVNPSLFLGSVAANCSHLTLFSVQFQCVGYEAELSAIVRNNPSLTSVTLLCSQSLLIDILAHYPFIKYVSLHVPSAVQLSSISSLVEVHPTMELKIQSDWNSFSYAWSESTRSKSLMLKQNTTSFEEDSLRRLFSVVGDVKSFTYTNFYKQPSVIDWLKHHGHSIQKLAVYTITAEIVEAVLGCCPNVSHLTLSTRKSVFHCVLPIAPQLQYLSVMMLSLQEALLLLPLCVNLNGGRIDIRLLESEELELSLKSLSEVSGHVAEIRVGISILKNRRSHVVSYRFAMGCYSVIH